MIGCRRLLELGLSRTLGRITPEMNCVRLQYNWMSCMGRTLLLGTQSSHLIDELAPLDTGKFFHMKCCIHRTLLTKRFKYSD